MKIVKIIPRILRPQICISFDKAAGGIKVCTRSFTAAGGIPGSGAGKGGGAGGTIREGGGSLGRLGAAQEDMYFYDRQKEQLQRIKEKISKDVVKEERVGTRTVETTATTK